jgi:hypothetical protein
VAVDEKHRTPDERDEPLEVPSRSQQTEDKEHKLDWIRKASDDELADAKIRDGLIAEAQQAGATQGEIDNALGTPG